MASPSSLDDRGLLVARSDVKRCSQLWAEDWHKSHLPEPRQWIAVRNNQDSFRHLDSRHLHLSPPELTFREGPVKKSHFELLSHDGAHRAALKQWEAVETTRFHMAWGKRAPGKFFECIFIQCQIRNSLLWSEPLGRKTSGFSWWLGRASIFLLKTWQDAFCLHERIERRKSNCVMTTDCGYPVTSRSLLLYSLQMIASHWLNEILKKIICIYFTHGSNLLILHGNLKCV